MIGEKTMVDVVIYIAKCNGLHGMIAFILLCGLRGFEATLIYKAVMGIYADLRDRGVI